MGMDVKSKSAASTATVRGNDKSPAVKPNATAQKNPAETVPAGKDLLEQGNKIPATTKTYAAPASDKRVGETKVHAGMADMLAAKNVENKAAQSAFQALAAVDGIPVGEGKEINIGKYAKPGDIMLTSSDSGRGCWYLSDNINKVLDPRYCHAELIIEVDENGDLRTIGALNEGQDVQIQRYTNEDLVDQAETKLAILRVRKDDGSELSKDEIGEVLEAGQSLIDAEYEEPPYRKKGDGSKTYCSLLPYSAYLNGVGINIDGMRIPLAVPPDALYKSSNTYEVYESSPEDPPKVPFLQRTYLLYESGPRPQKPEPK